VFDCAGWSPKLLADGFHVLTHCNATSPSGPSPVLVDTQYAIAPRDLRGPRECQGGSNTYVLTSDGAAFAVFYTKLGNRLLEPLLAANAPPAPLEVRRALRVIDHHIDDAIDHAR
jgi:hypothetical protein